MNMHKNLMLCLLTLMAVIVSCQKKDEVKPDARDAIAGRYEVWDSLYLFEGRDSISGNNKYILEDVFHYQLMEFVKSREKVRDLFVDDYFVDGLEYRPVITDTSYTSRNGYRYGLWVRKHDFQLQYDNTLKIIDTYDGLYRDTYYGEVKGDTILLQHYSNDRYSSAICIRIR